MTPQEAWDTIVAAELFGHRGQVSSVVRQVEAVFVGGLPLRTTQIMELNQYGGADLPWLHLDDDRDAAECIRFRRMLKEAFHESSREAIETRLERAREVVHPLVHEVECVRELVGETVEDAPASPSPRDEVAPLVRRATESLARFTARKTGREADRGRLAEAERRALDLEGDLRRIQGENDRLSTRVLDLERRLAAEGGGHARMASDLRSARAAAEREAKRADAAVTAADDLRARLAAEQARANQRAVEAERFKELVERMTEALDDLAAVRDAADTDEVPIAIPPQGERRDPEQVVEDRDRIYRYVLAHGRTTTREICERFRVPSQFVRDETKAMTTDGLLVRTGRGLFEAVPGKAVRPSLAGEVLAMARALPRFRLEDVKTDLTPASVHRAAQQLVQDGRLVRAREGARVFYSLPKDLREGAATDA